MAEVFACRGKRTSDRAAVRRAFQRRGVDSVLGAIGLTDHQRSGDEVHLDCPFCGKVDRLWMNAQSGLWICYRCSDRGDAGRLVEMILGVDRYEAVAFLTGEMSDVGGEALAKDLRRRVGQLPRVEDESGVPRFNLPAESVPVRPGDAAWNYLKGRGLTGKSVERFGLCWCRTGTWGGRLIVPVPDVSGEPMTFVARTIRENESRKYLNPPGSKKSVALFGQATGSEVILVEGVFDAMRWSEADLPVLAILGASLSSAQAAAIVSRFDSVTLCFDGDDAGMDGMRGACRMLRGKVSLSVIPLEGGADPGSVEPGTGLPGVPVRWGKGKSSGKIKVRTQG